MNTPSFGLYPFPRFVMTTGKTKVLVLQELLLDDTDAVNATFLDRSTKICYYYSTSFDYRLKFANIKKDLKCRKKNYICSRKFDFSTEGLSLCLCCHVHGFT